MLIRNAQEETSRRLLQTCFQNDQSLSEKLGDLTPEGLRLERLKENLEFLEIMSKSPPAASK
jgi:hypothetical protein